MSVRRIVKDGVLYTCIYGPDGDVLDMVPGLGDIPLKKSNQSGKARRRRAELFLIAQGGLCFYCNEPPAPPVTLDEVIPRSKGGPCSLGNVVAACHACNQLKRDRAPTEIELKRAADLVPIYLLLAQGSALDHKNSPPE